MQSSHNYPCHESPASYPSSCGVPLLEHRYTPSLNLPFSRCVLVLLVSPTFLLRRRKIKINKSKQGSDPVGGGEGGSVMDRLEQEYKRISSGKRLTRPMPLADLLLVLRAQWVREGKRLSLLL